MAKPRDRAKHTGRANSGKLHQLAEQFESRFYGQLRRHADEQRPSFLADAGQFGETDPPF